MVNIICCTLHRDKRAHTFYKRSIKLRNKCSKYLRIKIYRTNQCVPLWKIKKQHDCSSSTSSAAYSQTQATFLFGCFFVYIIHYYYRRIKIIHNKYLDSISNMCVRVNLHHHTTNLLYNLYAEVFLLWQIKRAHKL